MNKKEKELTGLFYWVFVMVVSVLLIILYLQVKENNKLKRDFDVYKVESELTLELLEDYYENEIYWIRKHYENEINWLENYYETKIKLLDKDTLNISQIMWDLDDLMEWTIRYYEVEPQTLRDTMELTEYILWKDNELYQRILNWWQ